MSKRTESQQRTKARHQQLVDDFATLVRCSTDDEERMTCLSVSRRLDISSRTLYALCQAYFGISPLKYMLRQRLQQVNTDLRTAAAHETVSSVMTRYGLFELGRYAGRYREIFNELPSATLQQAKQARGQCQYVVNVTPAKWPSK
jgi:methylphosphotriester-DNA--protein-cysteine methyltransferase